MKFTMIMKKMLFLFLLLFTGILYSQKNDTLIRLDEVSFSSETEEEAIRDFFQNGNADYLKLFLISSGINNNADLEKMKGEFTGFYSQVNTQKIRDLSENKKIKMVFKTVHDRFFKRYELKTDFARIFQKGEFNCVTASALYAIILNDLKIPFSVRETPVHVYIVAYPKVHDIKIESTDPLTGYYSYDGRTKKDFIDFMVKNKLISSEESGTQTIDDLFNKYFYADKEIGLKELLGLHYFNLALYKIDEKDFREAYRHLENSYLFYPSEKVQFVMMSTLAELVRHHSYDSLSDLDYFIKICRFPNLVTEKEVSDEFSIITYNYLINKSDLTYYEKMYDYLFTRLSDEKFKKEISFIYNYEKGRFLLNKGNHVQAHEFFTRAYSLKPEHSEAQTAFVQSLGLVLENMPTTEAVKKVENYYQNDSTLENNSIFKVLLLNAYLIGAYENFNMQMPKTGEDYIRKFETVYNKNRSISINEMLIGEAYSSAGIYYFKKGNYSRSKEYINRGLEFAPGNFKLIMSKNSF